MPQEYANMNAVPTKWLMPNGEIVWALPVVLTGASEGFVITPMIADMSITSEKFAEDAKIQSAFIADSAESVDWSDIQNKPAGFIPQDGSVSTIKFAVGAKSPLAGNADTASAVDWSNVGNKPTGFTPSDGSVTTVKFTASAKAPAAAVADNVVDGAITTAKFSATAKSPLAGTADLSSSVAWANVSGKPTTILTTQASFVPQATSILVLTDVVNVVNNLLTSLKNAGIMKSS